MIGISIRYLTPFHVITGKKQENMLLCEETTLRELFDILIKKYGFSFKKELFDSEEGRIRSNILVLVNGRSADQFKEKLNTPLSSGDSVIFAFPVSGG
jgi:MoaD family protein